jgi:hypothetical protein
MRRILLFSLACLPILIFAQAQRTVLIEEFTNASCGPCAAQNPAFNALLDNNEDILVSIKYQTDWPGYDPFNEQNPNEVQTRVDYYGVSGVPTAVMDGITPGDAYGNGIGTWDEANGGYAGGPYGYNQAVLEHQAQESTPLTMEVTHTLSEDVDSIFIRVVIHNVSDAEFTTSNSRLFMALVEEEVAFPEAPGNNGETDFFFVMRKMYPGAMGLSIGAIPAQDSLVVTRAEALPDYIYGLNQMSMVAFVQNLDSKEVFQADISEVQSIPNAADMAILANLTVPPTSLCGASIVPTVSIVNNGDLDVTSVSVLLFLNGSVSQTIVYDQLLATGETATITFDEVAVEGNLSVSFSIDEVNNGENVDINQLNNSLPSEMYQALSQDPIGTMLNEDNENYDNEYPETAVVNPPIPLGEFAGNSFLALSAANLPVTAPAPVGGYGESDHSIFINFYQWNPAGAVADEGTMTYQKIDLSGEQNATITFDRAGARYQGSNDRLQVLISTDCGGTYTVVHDIAGAALSTVDGHTETYYAPAANQWESDTIDISQFAGEQINVQFKALSAWGNNVFIDNIRVGDFAVGTDEPNLLDGAVEVFPNPASTAVNIDFQLVEATSVTIDVLDITGKLVTRLDENRPYASGSYIRTWNPADAGIYIVRIRSGIGEHSERVIVTK